MAEARSCDAWNRAALLIREVHNAWFSEKWDLADVHPFAVPESPAPQKTSDVICDLFNVVPPVTGEA